MKDFTTQTHESYGLLSFSRISGGPRRLFGTSLNHENTITLTLRQAELDRGLNRHWYHGTKNLFEVEMSQSQFAELITSLNCGEGVPVTIRQIPGKIMEPCPYVNPLDIHKQEFKELNQKTTSGIANLISHVKDLFNTKKNLTKKDKDEIISTLEHIRMDLQENTVYQLSAFNDQMNKSVTEAKAEIEAFFENRLANNPSLETDLKKPELLDGEQ